jgi:hypothetical protein
VASDVDARRRPAVAWKRWEVTQRASGPLKKTEASPFSIVGFSSIKLCSRKLSNRRGEFFFLSL